MWRDTLIVAVLGMGWVFCFLALFAGVVKLVAMWQGGRNDTGAGDAR